MEHYASKLQITSIGSLVTEAIIKRKISDLKKEHTSLVYFSLVADIAGAIVENLAESDEYDLALELTNELFEQIVQDVRTTDTLVQEAKLARQAGYVDTDDEAVLQQRILGLLHILVSTNGTLSNEQVDLIETIVQLQERVNTYACTLEPTSDEEQILGTMLVDISEEEEKRGFSQEDEDFIANKLGYTVKKFRHYVQQLETEIACHELQKGSAEWTRTEFFEFLDSLPNELRSVSMGIENVVNYKITTALQEDLEIFEPDFREGLLQKARALQEDTLPVDDNTVLREYLYYILEKFV